MTEDSRLNDVKTGFEGKSVNDYHEKRNSSSDPYTFRNIFDGLDPRKNIKDNIANVEVTVKEID